MIQLLLERPPFSADIGVDPLSLSKLVEEGRKRPWHFRGNVSLFNFDGNVRPSHHSQIWSDRAAIRILAGPYNARSLHLAGSLL